LRSRRAQHRPLALVLGVYRAQPHSSTSASRPCARGIPRAAEAARRSPVACGYVCDKTLGQCAFKLSTNRVAVTTDRALALVNLDVLLTGSNNVLTGVATSPICGACHFAARACAFRAGVIRCITCVFWAVAFGELCGCAALNIGLSPLCSGCTARSRARQHRLLALVLGVYRVQPKRLAGPLWLCMR